MILSLRLALRYVFSNKKQPFSNYASFLAIGGLSIGVASLMLTASIINGFEKMVTEKLELIIGRGRITNIFNHTFDPKGDFNFLNNKYSVFDSYIQAVSMFRYGDHADGILVEGLEKLPNVFDNVKGSPIKFGEIIVGKGILDKTGCQIGDTIYLQSFDKVH